MLAKLRKRSGNRFTLMSILLIIVMLFIFRTAYKGKNQEYPQTIYYNEHRYVYNQTTKEASFKFVRNYGKNYNGYVILTMRADKGIDAPQRVYIFEGWRSYREYERAE